MQSAPATPRPVGRPRDPDVDERILTATQDLLIAHGYAGTTIDAVARAAGSGKAAVYRRWPRKIDLVVAAVRVLHTPPSVPDTGSLRDDLLACGMLYAHGDDRPPRVLASLLSELGRDAELYEAAYKAIGEPPVAAIVAVIERWMQRGVVAPSTPVALVAGILPSIAFGSVTLRQRALDPQAVESLVDHVLLPALGAPLQPSG